MEEVHSVWQLSRLYVEMYRRCLCSDMARMFGYRCHIRRLNASIPQHRMLRE